MAFASGCFSSRCRRLPVPEPAIEAVVALSQIDQQLRRLELTAELLLERLGNLDEGSGADAVDIGERTAGIGREAERQDRADIGLARIGDDPLLHHPRRL